MHAAVSWSAQLSNAWPTLVLSRRHLPAGLIIAEAPFDGDSTGRLDDVWVLGRMRKRMKIVQLMQRVAPIGILTSLRHWRVCWLPESDAVAAALPPPITSGPGPHIAQPSEAAERSSSSSGSSSEPPEIYATEVCKNGNK